jgi:hypothetical protein
MLRRCWLSHLAPGTRLVRFCSTAAVQEPTPTTSTSATSPRTLLQDKAKQLVDTFLKQPSFEELSTEELIAGLKSSAYLGTSKKDLSTPLTELQRRLAESVAVKSLTVSQVCDALELLGRVKAFGTSDKLCQTLTARVLNDLHACPPGQILGFIDSISVDHNTTSKSFFEAAVPLLVAKADRLSLRQARLALGLAIKFKQFDPRLFNAMEEQIESKVLAGQSLDLFLDALSSFSAIRYAPRPQFFELWEKLHQLEAVQTEVVAKERLLAGLKALREIRRKPKTARVVVDGIATKLQPLAKDLYITEVTQIVVDLAELGYVQRMAPRSLTTVRDRNDAKLFKEDCLIVACADRTLQLKDALSIDLLKELAFGFAALEAHYFRLWTFFSEKVKSVVSDIDPIVLASIVKHMARAKYCDDNLWKRITPTLLKRIPAMPAPAIAVWSDALRSTSIGRKSKTNDLGDPIRTSLLPELQSIVEALALRLVKLLSTAGKDDEKVLAMAFSCLGRTVEMFFPNAFPHRKALLDAKNAYIGKHGLHSEKGAPSKAEATTEETPLPPASQKSGKGSDRIQLESADAALGLKGIPTPTPASTTATAQQ